MPTFDVDAAIRAGASASQIQQFMQANNLKPKKTFSGFGKNIFKSGGQLIEDTAGAFANIFNPNTEKNTVVNLGKLILGAGQLAIPGEQGLEDTARQVGKFYADRYGSLEKAYDSFYNDPVGVVADLSAVIGGAGAVVKGIGSAGKVSGLTRAGEALSTAGRAIDPLQAAGRVVSRGVRSGATRFADYLDTAADRTATAGIGNPAKQAELARKGGRSVGSFIDEYNLYDRTGDAARQAGKNILSQYDELALKSGRQIPTGQVINAFDREINRLSKGVRGVVSDADKSKIAELINRKQQFLDAIGSEYNNPIKPAERLSIGEGGVFELKPENIDPALRKRFISSVPIQSNVSDVTNFRRKVIDPDVPQSMFGLDARGSGSAQGVKKSRDIVKSAIDSSDKRLAKLGRDYGFSKGLGKILDQSASRRSNRQLFNFTKLGSAGVGSIVAGAPGVVAGFAAEQLVNSPQFLKAASKTSRAGSKFLQSTPQLPQGITNNAGRAYDISRAGRVVSRGRTSPTTTNIQNMQPEMPRLPYKPRSNFQNAISKRMKVNF